MFTPEDNEKGACDCPYKRSCHEPRQWLQDQIRKEDGSTIESCDFYPLLKEMYESKGETLMIKPTVGRIVYYKSYGTPNGEYKPEDRAAIITGVVDDETVHLCVFNPTGLFLNQNVKRGEQGGQWDWMPYQKGQAAKTEELEKQLTGGPIAVVE